MRMINFFLSFMFVGFLSHQSNGQDCVMEYCNTDIRVGVGFDCQGEIIPEYIFGPFCELSNYQLTIFDSDGNEVPNPVTSEYFYMDLVAELVDITNDDTCSTNVIVEDKLLPVIHDISGPSILTCLDNLEELFTVNATDNCEFTTEISDISYSCEDCPVILVAITWTVTDLGNNQDSRTLIRDLVDFWDNVIWPSDFVVACEGDLNLAPIPEINTLPGCEGEYEMGYLDYRTECSINREWTITHVGSGLQTSHIQHLLIHDITPPEIIAKDEYSLSLEEYLAGWEFIYDVIDECNIEPGVYVSHEIVNVSCDPPYFKVIYTVSAEDNCDNTSTHETVVHVKSKKKTSVKVSGKKSCYVPFMIYTEAHNMFPPLEYSYTINNLTWSVDNLGNGKALVYPGTGKVIITAIVKDQKGCKSKDFIKFNCHKLSPVTRSDDADDFDVYPNPAAERLFISGNDIREIRVFDLTGQLMLSFTEPYTNEVDITELDSGMYIVDINTTIKNISKRFVKM